MLNNVLGIHRVVIATGYVDLRKGIDGLAQIVKDKYKLDPFEKGTLFLFCGKRTDRFKFLLWMGNGFLLGYKRLENGSICWPRTPCSAVDISEKDFKDLMRGFDPVHPRVREVHPRKIY